MKIRSLSTIFTIFLVFIFIGIVLFLLRHKDTDLTDARKAIPQDAAIIIETRNFPALLNQLQNNSLVWKELRTSPSLNRVNTWIVYLDSLFKNNDFIAQMFSNRKVVLSIKATTRRKVSLLLAVPLETGESEKETDEQLHSLFSWNSMQGKDETGINCVHNVSLTIGRKPVFCSYALSRRIFIFGLYAQDIEDAMARLNRNEIFTFSPGYIRVAGTAGAKVPANIYVQYEFLDSFLSSWLPEIDQRKSSFLAAFSKWGEYDLSLKNDVLIMNGFTFVGDSANTLASLFLSQNPSEIRAISVIPQGIAGFIHLGISDFSLYFAQYSSYLNRFGKSAQFLKNLKEANDSTGINWVEFYSSILDGELGIIYMQGISEKEEVHYVRIRSRSYAEQKLESIILECRRKSSSFRDLQISEIKLNADSSVKIYEMPVLYLHKTLLGHLFAGSEDRFCTFCGNYMLFGNTAEILHQVIDSISSGQVLNYDIAYHASSVYMDKRSNFSFYHNTNQFPSYFNSNIFPDSVLRADTSIIAGATNIQAVVYQFTRENGMIYNNLFIKHVPVKFSAYMREWQTRLQAPVAGQPQIVVNHNAGTHEIIMQDTANNLYLISNSGTILWKTALKERIMGEIHQIDFYRNKKLQYFFNTATSLYLIDRRGKITGSFPVRLESPATNAVAVFDYEGNRDYRYMIACRDNIIHAYDHNGKTLKGWKSPKTGGNVTLPVNHYKVGDKDYIAFSDGHEIYILNRKGEKALKSKIEIPSSSNELILEDIHGKTHLVFSDISGKIIFLSFDGNVKEKIIKSFSPNHFFDYKDIDGDGNNEYIFLDGKKLEVFRNDGSPFFNYSFDSSITQPPVFIQLSATDRKIGIVSSAEGKVYMLNRDGSLQKGFPVEGRTQFTIGNLDEENMFNLIVGGKQNFLYNYIVQYIMP